MPQLLHTVYNTFCLASSCSCCAPVPFVGKAQIFNSAHGHKAVTYSDKDKKGKRRFRDYLHHERLRDAFLKWKALDYISKLDQDSLVNVDMACSSSHICAIVSMWWLIHWGRWLCNYSKQRSPHCRPLQSWSKEFWNKHYNTHKSTMTFQLSYASTEIRNYAGRSVTTNQMCFSLQILEIPFMGVTDHRWRERRNAPYIASMNLQPRHNNLKSQNSTNTGWSIHHCAPAKRYSGLRE